MIIQKITWWLWNQMFQYAYIKSLALKQNKDFKLDITEFQTYFRPYELEIFDIEKNYTSKKEIPFYVNLVSKNRYLNFIYNKIKWIYKRFDPNYHIEKQFNFDKDFFHISNWYIEWYFQSEKYFKDFENEIKKDFTFIKPISKQNKEILEKIKNTESISLHVRRWDYVSNPQANAFHGTATLDYYKKAIEYIKKHTNNPTFYVFSDDIPWVKENLKIDFETHYIDWNTWKNSFEDMRIMSNCKHNIIANSSFSWWWAWLNNNKEKIVIAPKIWFLSKEKDTCDIIPDDWVKI